MIKAALDLWTERGFEEGIEHTRVDEIVEAAGVTKGTFYFHFSSKEEVLLEVGFAAATVVVDEAEGCLERGRTLDYSMSKVIKGLADQVRNVPPAAVGRAVAEFRRRPPDALPKGRPRIADGFEMLYESAMGRHEIEAKVDARELAEMTEAVLLSTLLDWVRNGVDMKKTMQRRAKLLVQGVRDRSSA